MSETSTLSAPPEPESPDVKTSERASPAIAAPIDRAVNPLEASSKPTLVQRMQATGTGLKGWAIGTSTGSGLFIALIWLLTKDPQLTAVAAALVTMISLVVILPLVLIVGASTDTVREAKAAYDRRQLIKTQQKTKEAGQLSMPTGNELPGALSPPGETGQLSEASEEEKRQD